MPEARRFFTFGKDQKRKSLSRYFIDEKIPRQLREEIPWWQMAVILYGSLAEESANIIRSKNQPSVI